MSSIETRELGQQQPPWDLLLLADPCREKVEEYLDKGVCFVAYSNHELVGAFVLIEKSGDIMEIANVAVTSKAQGKGIGKALVAEARRIAKDRGGRILEVGTGNSSIAQLAFYQKCGFRIVGIDRNYFVRNYEQEIIENGIKCLDMVRLSIEL